MTTTFLKHENIIQRTGPLTDDLKLMPSNPFGLLPKRLIPEKTLRCICGYCSTGCQLSVHVKQGKPVNLTATQDYPVNQGMACPKGWEALAPLKANDRGMTPLIKGQNGSFRPVSWDKALSLFCDTFKDIQNKYGRSSTAWIGTGQITNEELAYLGALSKFGMGWIHGDGNTRQCMASAVTAYKESFGFDAPPYTYADFETSDALVFVGANPCITHPILWQRVMQNRKRPDVIVIDPRNTETATSATHHLALKPKSDLTLFYAIARILIKNNWVDQSFVCQHTEDFEAFACFVEEFTIERAVRATGLTESDVMKLASIMHQKKAVSFWWTMGVNQSHQGTRTAQAIINLALLTGNIGRPGTGANSITGQCNAMGSRLFSNTTSLLGGRSFQNPNHRKQVAQILQIPVESIPSENSLPYEEILQNVENGSIKGLWIIATNPGHSWINQSHWLRLIRSKVEFLVVQDMFDSTETAREADLYLPAAGWGEKSGTFINSERRIGVLEPVSKPPGQARSDFEIFQSISEHCGCGEMFQSWKDPESTFQILKQLTKDQPCDFSGIDNYDMIDATGGIQWPWTADDAKTGPYRKERRLFEDGTFYHETGKARFVFEPVEDPQELPDEAFPYWLLTGRGTSAQWHTQTRTGKSPILKQMAPDAVYLEMHPEDARHLDIRTQEQVWIRSRRGKLLATAFVMGTVQPGQVFIPMHYPEVNQLTHPSFDSYSHQPSYKASAVQITKLT